MNSRNLALAQLNNNLASSLKKLHDAESIINRSPVIHCVWRFEEGAPLEYISGNVSRLGYSPDDFLRGQLSWYDITHPEDIEQVRFEVIRRVKEHSPMFTQIYRVFDRAGDVRWVEDQTVFIYNRKGKITHAQGAVLDITIRKQAEMRLQESEDRLQELMRYSSDIVVVLNEGGLFKYVSSAVERVLHSRQMDILGKSYLGVVHPDDAGRAKKAFQSVLDRENTGTPTLLRIRKADGDGEWADIEVLANNCLANPAIKGIVANAREISERKRLESQLQNAQKMEAIGRLAGGIAHDFNNILMGIQGYISLMMQNMDIMHPDWSKAENIQALVQSGADLTGKLLGFARGGHCELKPADVNEILAKTAYLFGRTKKEITVHQKYEKNPWVVEVDPVQIGQVILNLLVNAWQAMPQGGDIYIETHNVVFNETMLADGLPAGSFVKITVTDTGLGMDEATKLKIFEPFFTTKEKAQGVGLGLASSFGIIKEHGGLIDVVSQPGAGTTFSIYLPASNKEVHRETYQPKTIQTGRECILLVDDEASIVEVCRDILISLGYKIFTAGSGLDAVDIYKLHHDEIDLVILDMIMPGMNGSDTFNQLKAVNPQVRVVLSTGYSGSEQAQQILDNGCQAIIKKPFRVDDLSQTVRHVMRAETSGSKR